MIASCVSGVHTATQGSGSLARTVPPAKDVRKRAGMLSRFFASNECSKWPRNANCHEPGSSDRSGGVGGAPPLRSIGDATVPHYLPLRNTIPHLSVRWSLKVCRAHAAFGSTTRDSAGGEEWVDGPLQASFRPQGCDLGAIVRANRSVVGFLQAAATVPFRSLAGGVKPARNERGGS